MIICSDPKTSEAGLLKRFENCPSLYCTRLFNANKCALWLFFWKAWKAKKLFNSFNSLPVILFQAWSFFLIKKWPKPLAFRMGEICHFSFRIVKAQPFCVGWYLSWVSWFWFEPWHFDTLIKKKRYQCRDVFRGKLTYPENQLVWLLSLFSFPMIKWNRRVA